MKKQLLTLLLLLAAATNARPQDAESAYAIVKKADDRARGNTSIAEMTITTVRPKWSRDMKIKTWSKGQDLALVLVQSPAKDKGVTFLKRKKEVWNWIPSIERNIKLPPSMMSQSWMGTDFTNDDLVKESSAVSDYTHRLLGTELQGGRECHKIELIPKPEAAVVWGKLLLWIDKKDHVEMRVEFYDEDGAISQTMVGSDLKMLGGRLLSARMEMTPAGKRGHRTVIAYNSLVFDQPLADSFFTTENMTRIGK
ncbi:MAG: hypothetical protein RI973_2393 [Bacteroidota bacterium]|jgi:outer membrane lipoprotein-sorting protein